MDAIPIVTRGTGRPASGGLRRELSQTDRFLMEWLLWKL